MCDTPRRAHPAAQVRRQLISARAWSINTPPSKPAEWLPTKKLSSVPPASLLARQVDSNHGQLLGHAQQCSRRTSRTKAQPANLATREPCALTHHCAIPLLPSPTRPPEYTHTRNWVIERLAVDVLAAWVTRNRMCCSEFEARACNRAAAAPHADLAHNQVHRFCVLRRSVIDIYADTGLRDRETRSAMGSP